MSFSKENEIIELLNSSDNDFSLPHKSLCVNDPVSSASKSALNERHISSSSLSKLEQTDVVEIVGGLDKKQKIINFINNVDQHFKVKQIHLIESPTNLIYRLTFEDPTDIKVVNFMLKNHKEYMQLGAAATDIKTI